MSLYPVNYYSFNTILIPGLFHFDAKVLERCSLLAMESSKVPLYPVNYYSFNTVLILGLFHFDAKVLEVLFEQRSGKNG